MRYLIPLLVLVVMACAPRAETRTASRAQCDTPDCDTSEVAGQKPRATVDGRALNRPGSSRSGEGQAGTAKKKQRCGEPGAECATPKKLCDPLSEEGCAKPKRPCSSPPCP